MVPLEVVIGRVPGVKVFELGQIQLGLKMDFLAQKSTVGLPHNALSLLIYGTQPITNYRTY